MLRRQLGLSNYVLKT